MPIVYGSTPPAPTGMSDAQANNIREDLQEDSLQTLASYILAHGGRQEADAALDVSSMAAGISVERKAGRAIFTVPFSAFTAVEDVTATIELATVASLARITGALLIVDEAYAGTAGTVLVDVGFTDLDPNGLFAAADAEAEATLGVADADLGALLARATAVQGGSILADEDVLELTITSSSGDLTDLTAGSLRVIIKYDYFG